MRAERRLIPSSSQTVGPYFRIGLEYLVDPASPGESVAAGMITVRGRVLDRDRAPVGDAMLEFWTAGVPHAHGDADAREPALPKGFRRAATDLDGCFFVSMPRPVPVPYEDSKFQAPHMIVLVFARGLLRQLVTRVYFDGEPANDSDPVLVGVPADRRHTLIARGDGENNYRWEVILQGADETVFFAW